VTFNRSSWELLHPLSVLLPTDGSPSALRAAEWISTHAPKRSVSIVLLHVMVPTAEMARQEAFIAARRKSEEILEQTEKIIACCHPVETVTVIGIPHEQIVRFATDHDMDLILLGRRGHSKIGPWVGSVSFAVFQRSPIPVTIIEPPSPKS